jgi:hypothetical protein
LKLTNDELEYIRVLELHSEMDVLHARGSAEFVGDFFDDDGGVVGGVADVGVRH